MELITNIVYDESRHNLEEFLKSGFRPFIINFMAPKAVAMALDGKTIGQAMETIIGSNWTIMKATPGTVVGQMVKVQLADNAWVEIYLFTQGYGDRALVFVSGQGLDINYVDFGINATEEVFKDYCEKLGFTQIEVFNNIYHYVPDDDE